MCGCEIFTDNEEKDEAGVQAVGYSDEDDE